MDRDLSQLQWATEFAILWDKTTKFLGIKQKIPTREESQNRVKNWHYKLQSLNYLEKLKKIVAYFLWQFKTHWLHKITYQLKEGKVWCKMTAPKAPTNLIDWY